MKSTVLSALIKYREMKEEVRITTKKVADKETCESLSNKGGEEAIDSFQRMFNKNRVSFRKIFDKKQR